MKRSSLYAGTTIDRSSSASSSGPRAPADTLRPRELLRRVDPDGFHRILARERRDALRARDPRDERQKVALAGRGADLELARRTTGRRSR